MPSAKDAMDSKGESLSLLKGEDLYNAKPKLNEITVKFKTVRDPGADFFSPLVADLETEVLGKQALPLNKTNVKKLIELSGTDDYDKWAGARVTVERVLTNNPKKHGEQSMGLLVNAYKNK